MPHRTGQAQWVGNGPWIPDLALIRVEIICLLALVIGDPSDPIPIVPGGSVIITKEAEDPVPLQCPMATHDEAALPRLPLFLWKGSWVSQKETLGRLRGRPTPSVRTHLVPFSSVLAEGHRRIP